MAWNEPGGGKDPWGGNRNDQGPPDIDEALKKLKEKLGILVAEEALVQVVLEVEILKVSCRW